ncbi:MAG TPA: response regulator [Polyangiaceae bacterium]
MIAGQPHFRVLVVEDDEDLRSSLNHLLSDDGFDVLEAENGARALELLGSQQRPDVILLDLMMPTKDGWQFRIEQRRRRTLADIPVLAMSADDTAKASAIDADGYIRKPFEYPTLRRAMENIVRQRQQEHLDRLAALGTLAAGLAHEVNNPLTYVMANLQLVQEEFPRLARENMAQNPLPHIGGIEERVERALEGAVRIRRIVQQVMTFCRPEQQRRTLVDVRSVIDATTTVVLHEIRQRARLVVEYGPTPLVRATSGELGQLFLNLIVNAMDAIGEGDPDANMIRVATSTAPTGHAVVEVTDTGRATAQQQELAASELPAEPAKSFLGTGIGLAVCQDIATALRGSILVTSDEGRSTTFRVSLPPAAESGRIRVNLGGRFQP